MHYFGRFTSPPLCWTPRRLCKRFLSVVSGDLRWGTWSWPRSCCRGPELYWNVARISLCPHVRRLRRAHTGNVDACSYGGRTGQKSKITARRIGEERISVDIVLPLAGGDIEGRFTYVVNARPVIQIVIARGRTVDKVIICRVRRS